MMSDILEYNIRYYMREELGIEVERKIINFLPRDLQGEFLEWLHEVKARTLEELKD